MSSTPTPAAHRLSLSPAPKLGRIPADALGLVLDEQPHPPPRPHHRALGRTHADYARYLNINRASCGDIWQARFFSCMVGPEHLWMTVAYIERNPVRAGLAAEAEQYRWPSATSDTTGLDADHLIDMRGWRMEYTPSRWKQVLEGTVDTEIEAERIREATMRGRPLGGARFISDVESRLARTLRPKPVGRPRKSTLEKEPEQIALAQL